MRLYKIFLLALIFSHTSYAGNFIVTNTGNAGSGSLREAITQANANADASTISFAIAGTGPFTISPTTALPQITTKITIDGFTQSAGVYDIIVDGSSAPGGSKGFDISGSNAHQSIIKGLVIKNWSEGIKITNANFCQINQNVIHSNSANGIYLSSANYSIVKGNKIGTDITGTTDLGNSIHGIKVESSIFVNVGGAQSGDGNLISGNNMDGIYFNNSTDVQIKGNMIGTDITGTLDLGNSQNGIESTNNSYLFGTIGGYLTGEGNLISGNNSVGIKLHNGSVPATMISTFIYGNKIGTDVTGTSVISNPIGIEVNSYGRVIIGGTSPGGEANIIAASGGTSGVNILAQNRCLISGNKIYGFTKGINLNLSSGTPGNDSKSSPTIVSNSIQGQTVNLVGTSQANDRIEIFRSDGSSQNAIEYISTVTADGSGNWTCSLNTSSYSNHFIATATDLTLVAGPEGGYKFNTSEFSNMISVTVCQPISISGLPSSITIGSASVSLTGNPSGGTFSGPGISGNVFNPTSAGVGTHTITYSKNISGCPNATQQVTVFSCPVLYILNLPNVICPNADPITLTGVPSGGTFSGPGMSGNVFDPVAAGEGRKTITYTVNLDSVSQGCPNSTTKDVLVMPPATFKNRIISATANTYSDVWPQDYNATTQKAEFDKNELINGSKGIWKLEESYIYTDIRTQSATIDLKVDGVMNNVPMFNWESALNGGCFPGWRLVNTVTKYSPYSYELENKDILDIHSSALYAYQGNLTTAVAGNAKTAEIAFEGFEEYVAGNPVNGLNLSSGNLTFYTSVPSSFEDIYKDFEVVSAIDHVLTVDFPFANAAELQGKTIKLSGADFDGYTDKVVHGDYVAVSVTMGEDVNQTVVTLNPVEFTHIGIWKGKISVPYPVSSPVMINAPALTISNTKAHTGKNSLRVSGIVDMEQISLALPPTDTFMISCWISLDNADNYTFRSPAEEPVKRGVRLRFLDAAGTEISNTGIIEPNAAGPVIEGWQKIESMFEIPETAKRVVLQFNPGTSLTYFDDIRIFPFHSGIQTYVYHKDNLRLHAVLDANNYATLYYYDEQGNLYLVKKETERGIQTIQEVMFHPQEVQEP